MVCSAKGMPPPVDKLVRAFTQVQSALCMERALGAFQGKEWFDWSSVVCNRPPPMGQEAHILYLLDDVPTKTIAALMYLRPGSCLPFIHSAHNDIYGVRVLRGRPVVDEASQIIMPLKDGAKSRSEARAPLIEPIVQQLQCGDQLVRIGIPGVAHRLVAFDKNKPCFIQKHGSTVLMVHCIRP